MRVVALHRVQLVAVVPPRDGVNVAAQHAHAVVGVLLLQRLDGTPAVMTRVVPAERRKLKSSVTEMILYFLNVSSQTSYSVFRTSTCLQV